MVVGLVMAMVVVSVVVADIEECCDGTVRFSQVRFVPPPSTAILALVEVSKKITCRTLEEYREELARDM